MDYILTAEQIDKLMKPYFDYFFEESKLGTYENEGDNTWYGVISNKKSEPYLIVGRPIKDSDPSIWFYDGTHFGFGDSLYNISRKEFNKAMTRYINKRFKVKIIGVE